MDSASGSLVRAFEVALQEHQCRFHSVQPLLARGPTPLSAAPSLRSVKRVWLPNVQRKALWSEALGRSVSLNVTTAALRNMDRVGGLDEYILRTTPAKLASAKGESLRKQITWANGVKANLLALNAAGAAPGSAPAQGAPPTLQ